MARIEDLVRESLRQRAEDVEPTPALWREVDRRIARRRRFQVGSWSLAAVTAALAAFVIVPGLLGGNDPSGLEIEPMAPTGGVVPSVAVVAGDDGLALLDLTDGQRMPLGVGSDDPIAQIAVRPGSTLEDHGIAVVQTDPAGASGATLTFIYGPEPGGVSGVLRAHAVEPGFVPTIQWSPDGELVAYTVPGTEGRGDIVIEAAPTSRAGGFLDHQDDAGIGWIADDAQLIDWVGSTTGAGTTSTLVARGDDGVVTSVPVITGDTGGVFAQGGDARPLERIEGAEGVSIEQPTAVASVGRGGSERPAYALAPGADGGASLYWIDGQDAIVEVPLSGTVEDVDLDDLWLDARQDAALVGDGTSAWMFAHDGDGEFAPPVEVPEVALGALFDASGVSSREAVDEPGPVEDATPEPQPSEPDELADADEPADVGEPADAGDEASDDTGEGAGSLGVLPEPVVIVSADELRLIGPDGPQTLVTLDEVGESRFVSARVRPGSTLEDLTVVALTTAEGLWDLWDIRVVDGQVTRDPLAAPYAPGFNSPAGEGVAIAGPVWSPDGGHLAWFEFGTGPATLRTIGWDEGPGTGETATDNAHFELAGLPSQPLLPMEWVEVPGTAGLTEIRGTLMDFADGWISVPLEIQGDGALAQPASSPAVVVEPGPSGPGDGEPIGAVASAPGRPGIGFMVRSTFEGAELVLDPYGDPQRIAMPREILPGDGLPEYWIRPIGDGALVGSPNTALAWFVAADGTLQRLEGQVVDADVLR